AERAAAAVLTGEADRRAFAHQAAEGEHLGAAPIDAAALPDRFETRLVDFRDLRMDDEILRRGRCALRDLEEDVGGDRGLRLAIPGRRAESLPGVAEAEDLLPRPEIARVGERELEDLVDFLPDRLELGLGEAPFREEATLV